MKNKIKHDTVFCSVHNSGTLSCLHQRTYYIITDSAYLKFTNLRVMYYHRIVNANSNNISCRNCGLENYLPINTA